VAAPRPAPLAPQPTPVPAPRRPRWSGAAPCRSQRVAELSNRRLPQHSHDVVGKRNRCLEVCPDLPDGGEK